MHVDELLEIIVARKASDLHLKAGGPAYARVDGQLFPITEDKLTDEDTMGFLDAILDEDQYRSFKEHKEIDLAYSVRGLGRFRTNVFRQRGAVTIVMRRINTEIQNFDELNLPPAMYDLARYKRGLILITGTTGSGKSTTLAALIDYINQRERCHIVTIEDPIEYLHTDKMAVINQREVSIDTESFQTALKTIMRQDPDVILIGEMRDQETFQAAISASETGHLVFSTLHTTDAMQTIDRIVDLYPSNQQQQIRAQLALQLKAVVCQRLLPRRDGLGRVPAVEVMIVSPAIQKLIRENDIPKIPMAIRAGREEGMQTFNDSLKRLYDQELISSDVALAISDNPEELQMLMQGIVLSSMRGGVLKGRGQFDASKGR